MSGHSGVCGPNGDGQRDWESAWFYFLQAREADGLGMEVQCENSLYLMNVFLKRAGRQVHTEHLRE